MAKQQGLHAYEERYRLVFAAGALRWNDPRPNPYLSHLLEQFPLHSNCIEFGCGEGYQARFITSRGHSVIAIDLSPTAIAKAVRETSLNEHVVFLVGDVTDAPSLNLPGESFDLAVDIGCLHMMAEDEDRANYLGLVHNVLKMGGTFFLQDGLSLDDVSPESDEEARQLSEEKVQKNKPPGYPTSRKIVTPDGEQEILVPMCPTCWMLSLREYLRELSGHGFHVLSAERVAGVNTSHEAVLVTEKVTTP